MATRKGKRKTVRKRKKTVGRKAKAKKKSTPKGKKRKPAAIGVVTHYFPQVKAAVVELKRPLRVGDQVLFQGYTTNFTQKVKSMQINHEPIHSAKGGDEIGLEVKERVREHDLVLPAKKGLVSEIVSRLPFG